MENANVFPGRLPKKDSFSPFRRRRCGQEKKKQENRRRSLAFGCFMCYSIACFYSNINSFRACVNAPETPYEDAA